MDAELLVRDLERGGYDVAYVRVQTREEMSAALGQMQWDAVLSDYSLPEFDGMEALEVLKSSGHDLPFIIVSGTIGEETAVTALKAGAHDFLVKGRLARLIPALERERREVAQRRERQRLEEQLRQAQKMEGIGRLAGGIAHDFNNMLTTIMGYSEMILDQIGTDKPISADLLEIKKAGERAADLTRQLLAFSRQQVLQIRPLDLNEVIRNMRPMLQRLIREDITIELSLGEELCSIRADRVQLEQVLMNIAANARDAMPEGGTLAIGTASADVEEVAETMGLPATAARYIKLTMADTGTGMDAHTREHLFEPFFTTKELGKGTGLGLATVYGIVKQLGGYISVSSQVGHGTTFTFFFQEGPPQADAASTTLQAKPAAHVATQREVVLVVEDEDGLRKLVHRALARHGYRVLEAGGPEEGLKIAAQAADEIDLIVTDVVMPMMSGPQMVAQLREITPRAKVLYMSGYAGDAMSRPVPGAENAPLIGKPFTAHELLRVVRELLDGG